MSAAGGAIRLLIVDDHPIFRDGLRGIFAAEADLLVVGEVGNGAEALAVLDRVAVDVVLLDLRMPELGGVETIRRLGTRPAPPRVLVLTTYDTERDVLPAIEAGATGYLLKDAPRDELLRAVRAAARGEPILSPAIAARVLGQLRRPATAVLSPREREVLGQIAAGATNREIAAQLFVSEATIKTHLLHIYEKLAVRDRAAAVGEAYRRGLLG